jgi:diaminopimelate decarboxylase
LRLAEEFGTPLYVLSEPEFRRRCAEYARSWALGGVSYAAKANSSLAVLAWAADEGLGVDVASVGELEAAHRAGVPGSRCRLHGNFKTTDEVAAAAGLGVGEIVADSLGEIEALAKAGWQSRVVLRLAPDVEAGGGSKISTAGTDTKFGMSIATGDAAQAVRRCLELGLRLHGYHCHVGSMLMDEGPVLAAARVLASFAAEAGSATGYWPESLNLGGGLGVSYVPGQEPLAPADYCAKLSAAVRPLLTGRLEGTSVELEPGRSVAAPSGVTLYRVGVIKRSSAGVRHVIVDGGMSDNPRPALYGAQYSVVSDAAGPPEPATVSGRHCETDLLFPGTMLPSGLREGDVLQVLCTGAYNAGMASNYNRFLRPASVALRGDGSARLVERRETLDDLFRREEALAR